MDQRKLVGLAASLLIFLSVFVLLFQPSSNGFLREEEVQIFSVEEDSRVFPVEEEDNKVLNIQTIVPKPSFLSEVKCIPMACDWPKRFISTTERILLASFPGSGNTWLRAIVEDGTKTWSGSVYFDKKLYLDGFKGENVNVLSGETSPVSVIKTHYPVYAVSSAFPQEKVTAVIQILRSPFDALLAEFNREYGSVQGSHSAHAPLALFKSIFPKWFLEKSALWRRYVHYWLASIKRIQNDWLQEMEDARGVTSFTILRSFLPNGTEESSTLHKIPMLVLFYEDFAHNLDETCARLFQFLNPRLKSILTTLESVICAVKDQHAKEKRLHLKEDYNPYTDPESAQALVAPFCELAKGIWFADKWGDCLYTTPQLNHVRHVLVPTPPLPKQECV